MSRKSTASTESVATGSGSTSPALALAPEKLRKKWQFAADAIGMFSGPRNLSRRKGLSA
jgi:hypothetical protein